MNHDDELAAVQRAKQPPTSGGITDALRREIAVLQAQLALVFILLEAEKAEARDLITRAFKE